MSNNVTILIIKILFYKYLQIYTINFSPISSVRAAV